MTVADIPLASGLRHIADDCIAAVRAGVRRFWRGGEHANAPTSAALSMLNAMLRVLRFTFVLLALHLELAPLRPDRGPPGPHHRPKARAPRKPGFRLFAPYRIVYADAPTRAQPAAFVRAAKQPRDRFLTVRRKLDALTRALADPMPLIRRIARKLPTQLMVFGWRPPRRPPRRDRRHFYEELIAIHREASFHLSQWRRRTRDTAHQAPG